jgi:NAD(P)-dependent dehydrogenase (short-subunit alcohol dehydrogenase family)
MRHCKQKCARCGGYGGRRARVYGQTKLANLLFTSELQRRLDEAGSSVRAVAAHPGYASTHLQSHTGSRLNHLLFNTIGNRLLAQSEEMGALPTLYAATQVVGRAKAAQNTDDARRLWTLSEELTGVSFGTPRVAAASS